MKKELSLDAVMEMNCSLQEKNRELSYIVDVLREELSSYHNVVDKLESALNIKLDNLPSREIVDNNPDAFHALRVNFGETNLSGRSLNILRYMGCQTLGDLVSYSKTNLLRERNCGNSTIEEVSQLLESYGLTFDMDIHPLVHAYVRSLELSY